MPEAINISDIQLLNLTEANATAQKQYEYISKDFKTFKEDLYQNFSTKKDLVREIALTRENSLKEIHQSKVDMIKWMFGFWVTLVLLILANWFLKH